MGSPQVASGRSVTRSRSYCALWLILISIPLYAQQPPDNTPSTPSSTPSPDETISAGQTDEVAPERKFNTFEGRHFSIGVGFGFLLDYAGFAQDTNSTQQVTLHPDGIMRDARLLLRGKLKFFKRPVSWSTGIMYNEPTHSWQLRQTGLMIAVPEILGNIFIGRTKEGISMSKIMVGYHGWTSERATINDAAIPILGDGVKWIGYSPKAHLVWNAGAFGDLLSEGLAFSTYRRQYVGRLAYVNFSSPNSGKLIHVGSGIRYGNPKDDTIRLRSRPEVYPAPYFIDTGILNATATTTIVPELYYRDGPVLFGSEYMAEKVNVRGGRDPWFHGGEVFGSWIATGETRGYNTRSGSFDAVSPARPVFSGGPGAWELVTRFSYTNLDSAGVTGGNFWRFTPMVNWHMSENVRLEFEYGYGSLERFGTQGFTHYFQTRIQFSL